MSSVDLSERTGEYLAPLVPAHSSILIGLSGGADSVVLLHLLCRLAARFSWKLSALHVHHGISPNADAWADFCTGLCASHAVPLHVEHVDITPLRAYGIEAAARKLRYAAFAGQECDFVALAHHAGDQAETLLLQLLRGAGVRGASAMSVLSTAKQPLPAVRESSPNLLRPLLGCSRREILDYAATHDLRWIEDESNADDSYPRNFLRHRVLPLLEQRFPACSSTLARSAGHFAEASELLDDLARMDAASALCDGTLAVAALQALTRPRAKNLLRWFLHSNGVPMPQAAQLDDMLHQLCDARQDAAVCIGLGDGWEVRRYRGRVYALRAPGEFDRSMELMWRGEPELEWPALNVRLVFEHTPGTGISLAKLRCAPVMLRLRQGGEALSVHQNGPTRTLRNLFQEHHVPPWRRDRLPLLYCGGELVCAAGVAIAAKYRAAKEEEGISVGLLP